jgi:predicted dehydrogenase
VPLTVGQIGAFPQVAAHLRAYVDAPQVGQVVLAAADDQARAGLYDRFGIIKQVYDDSQAVLDSPDVSVVDICAPDASRSSLAVAALEAGKHVICASPPATSLAEFDAMVETAERTGRRLFVAIPECMVPANQKAEQLLAEEELGQVLLATALVVSGPQQEGPAAIATDLSSLLYGTFAVLQRWLGTVAAASTVGAGMSGDPQASHPETMAVNLEMSGGAVAQIAATVAGTEPRPTAERRIIGTTAQLLIRDDPEDEVPIIGMEGHLLYPVAVHNPPFIMQHATCRLLCDFIECIVEQREPAVTLQEARACLSTLLAADRSRHSGQTVRPA